MANKSKWDPYARPLSQREMITQLSTHQKKCVFAWLSLLCMSIGAGFAFLAREEVLPVSGPPTLVSGFIRSVPVPIRKGSPIVLYGVRTETATPGLSRKLSMYARLNGCPALDLVIGREIRLSFQTFDLERRLIRAETLDGCLIFDESFREEVRKENNRPLHFASLYFFGWAFCSVILFFVYKRRCLVTG